MKKFAFLKLGAATIAVAVLAFFVGCTEDPNARNWEDSTYSSGDGNSSSGGGGGNTAIKPTITIKNNTGYAITGIYIKPSTSTSWGNNLYGYNSLYDGQSRTFTLSQSLSAQSVYDITISGGSYEFRKYRVSVSEGMIITFNASDLYNGDVPTITIQNRTGVDVNSLFIKPSVSSDWGESFGSISNNSDLSKTIPIPPSSYTVFDIKVTYPLNTYTKNNVTISDGDVVTFTTADAETPPSSPVIVIQNNTGYAITGIYIKPSTSTSWGNNLYGYNSLYDGQSRTFTLSQSLSAQSVYDITISGGGYEFRKYRVSVSEGMIITFNASDLYNGDVPTITIQNRTGVDVNSLFIKPSVSSDWGESFGSISNNSDLSKTIPIPPSSYTVFDIKVTYPLNTYTKNNVTISDGDVVTFTTADAETPPSSPVIVIQNNTGYAITGIYIKPSTSTSWGNNLYGYNSLYDGQSRTFTLSQSLSAQSVYDITISGGSYEFRKYNLSVSEGMIITFNASDLEE